MKKLLILLLVLLSIKTQAQLPTYLGKKSNTTIILGKFQVDSSIQLRTVEKLTVVDTALWKPVIVDSFGNVKALSTWPVGSGSGTTETASNGLAKTLLNIKLGGPLTEATSIDNSAFALNIGQNYFSNNYNFLPFADATNTMAAFQNGGIYDIFSQKTSDRSAGFGYSNSTVSVNGAAKQVLIGSYMPFSLGPPAPAFNDSLSTFIQVVPSLVNITARQTTINGLYANINAFTNFLPEETDSVLALPSYKRLQGMQWYDAARRTPKYWGGVRAENSNHVIYVENLQGYATDNEKLQAAINFATEGDIVLLEDGKTYNIDKGLSVPRSMVIRGGNKTVLKRENQITYTLVQAASQNDTVIRVNSIAGLHVGMPFSLAADTTYKGTTYPYYITRLAADSVYLSDSIGTTVNGNTTYPIGTKGYKSIIFMEITEASQQGSLSVTVENIIFDGNRDNNRGTYLWNHNMGVVASSKGITYIKNSTFKNSPSESLLGANLNVTGTKFYNINGSGIHLSFAASQNMGREFRSSITGNTFDSTNKYPSFTIGGHSEGVITSSNSGAYAYIAGNVFKNVLNDALFGALYGPTHADNMGTNNLTITGNIVDNVPKLVYLIDTVSGVIDNVYIKGNQINNLGTYVDYNEWLPRLQPKVIIDQYNKDTIWRSGTNVYARRNSLTYLEHTDSIGVGGSMVYPGVGIPLSTGSAWGTSITNNSANWNTAFGWGNHSAAGYAPIASPTFTGTVGGITKSMVGLSNVDNTTDALKPVSTATQTALNLKQNTTTALTAFLAATTVGGIYRTGTDTYASRTITGSTNINVADGTGAAANPTISITGSIGVTNGGTGRATATTAYGLIAAGTTATGIQQTIAPGTSGHLLVSNGASVLAGFRAGAPADVALGSVNNTSDANKPVSTATQTALDLKLNIADAATTYQPLGSYLTANQTITLTGAVTGIGSTTINTVINTADAGLTGLVSSMISDSTKEFVVVSPLQLALGAGIIADTLRIDTITTAGVATKSNLNLKQNLVTLTTTGSSGAATFNQSTGALNIPNYDGNVEVWIISISDQTTALTTGTGKFTFRAPYGASVTSVKASLKTTSSSGIPTFDINKNGTTILSTKLTIDASEKTSNTAAVSPVISVPGLDDDSEITIDIDVAGTGAIGAIIYIYHTKTGA